MQRCRSRLWAVAFAMLLPWSPAVADPGPLPCAVPADLSTLSGTWQAEALAHVSGGVAPSLQRLQLQVGRDGRVRGHRDWARRCTPARGPCKVSTARAALHSGRWNP